MGTYGATHKERIFPLFDEKKALSDIAKKIMDATASMKRGDIIPFAMIESVSGITRYTTGWASVVKKLKRLMLQERQIALWPVVSVGYKLCTKEEQLNKLPVARQKRATRQITRSIFETESLDTEGLSDHQKRVKALRVHQMIQSRRLIKRNIKRQSEEASNKASNAMPIRPR